MHNRIVLIILSFFIYSFGAAQNITPKGRFLKDNIQIGEPIAYVLSIKYPKELEIIFPDSLHNYSPFELSSKVYFPTKSDSIFSRDSAVYYLSTFEIDTVQYLRLPVYQINEFDSVVLITALDSIILNQVVITIPDSVAMITNTEYIEVPMAFNYPYATIGIIVSIIIVLAIWLIFGKTIKRRIKIFRLKKRHIKFISSFDEMIEASFLNTESILSIWKSYMEKLIVEPFTKLTTKEIVRLLKERDIESALMAIDRNIYGPKDESLLENAYKKIREVAVDEYNDKVKQLLNG